jgi:apolipoprotein N-acyltransferase
MAAVVAMLAMSLHQWAAVVTVRRLCLPFCLLLPAVWQALPISQGWTQPQGQAEVTLLQGNIAQDEKFQPGSGVPDALRWYGDQLQQATSPLTIAPETAIPLLPDQLPPGYEEALRDRFASGRQAALFGIPMGHLTQGYTNAVIGLKPGQSQAWQYDKHHLVPFGEFIPPWFRWFTELMNNPMGSFNRGGLDQASFEWNGQTWGVHICFEDLFGEELAQRFLSVSPSIFVNVSNIAWFGQSQAPDQHLAISRLRALEFERPFVRATNTGMTVAIDHTGQVVAQLPRFERATLQVVVQGRQGTTPYVWWVARLGLWPLWGLGILVLVLCWQLRRKEAP